MAKRRMFSSEITTSDAFTQMSLGSQALYFHLGMNADDDGVVNNYKMIQRAIGANDDDLKVLVAKRFIIPIEEAGIIVIKHWRINNYIHKDRYTPSKYRKDLELLGLDRNGCYSEKLSLFEDNKRQCIQNGYTGKISIDKIRLDNKYLNNNIENRDLLYILEYLKFNNIEFNTEYLADLLQKYDFNKIKEIIDVKQIKSLDELEQLLIEKAGQNNG